MSEELNPRVCVDQILPEELWAEADRVAMAENPANRRARFDELGREIALEAAKLWQPGRTLSVRFLEGLPEVQAKVEKYAQEWSKYANIKFAFGNDPNANIRISFQNTGSWSTVGTDALLVSPSRATMNYGWLKPDTAEDEYSRVVLHEFGHALGCIHEHQHPEAGIRWNKPVVYEWYEKHTDWDRAKVDFNLFRRYSVSQTQFSAFDPQSIMLYPIDPSFTEDGFSVGYNRVLSPTDIAYMGTVYPFPQRPVSELEIDGEAVQASIASPEEEDLFTFRVASPGAYVVETGGSTDVVMRLFGPDDQAKLIAADDDSGPGWNARIAMNLEPGQYFAGVRHYYPERLGHYTVGVRRASEGG